ncbi:MAG: putative peptidoglycan glycosyltransferase FtsW [Pseudomonadota bacterium]
MVSRAERGPIANWWWTVDKFLLTSCLLLLAGGFLLSLSASPSVTARLEIDDTFYFVKRHAFFLLPALCVLVGASFLSIRQVRRISLLCLAASIVVLALLPFIGASAKGATRWLAIAGFQIQPSEFMKPAFVVICAFLFAEGTKRSDIPANLLSICLFGLCAVLLIIQPDIGQTVLIAMVWGSLFFMAGMSRFWIVALGAVGASAMGIAYLTIHHVRDRLDRFFSGTGDNFQVERGVEAITNGGWLGVGPGEGHVKYGLPDSHTDFIFAVASEEYGVVFSMLLVTLFAAIVLRALFRALRETDRFVQLAASGLALMFGLQAMINICVNLRLVPAKGMTLPFVSYGGSSLVAVAFGMGMLLALTRRRAESYRRGGSPLKSKGGHRSLHRPMRPAPLAVSP